MIELVYKINSKVMEVIAMFMKELAVILIQGGLLIILALAGYFFFNDNKKKTKCNHVKKTLRSNLRQFWPSYSQPAATLNGSMD